MPLWKVYHPVGAFTAEDKKKLAKQVTELYANIPIPKFYVVFIFERTLDEVIAPFVKDRGYDWEITIDETPFDLWSLHGELPPPFESVAEKRWVKENKASPYTITEKLPVNLALAPGISDR